MNFQIYNTLTGNKEDFTPLQAGKIGMYVCGVTVYDYCHVGHARAGVVFDTIFRYLKHIGYDVTYVRNFTDIDDKIINRANEQGVAWDEITRKFIDAFYEDMDRLNMERPNLEPKATECIPEMIDMISTLEKQGKAYSVDGDVYYSVSSFADYGCLSKRKREDLLAGARVEVDDRKRDPLDFALWKKSKPGEPSWESPWGPGRPGWHIECSAMGQKFLGKVFDIHGGGKDLVFPHHENEIAQSCGATGSAPVRYWVHNGFVNINKEKMSKSLGNFFTIRDILDKYHPEVLRWFLLSSHYRNPIDFSDSNLEEAERVMVRFYEFLDDSEKVLAGFVPEPVSSENGISKVREKFREAMNDDFNTAIVQAILNEELRRLNQVRDQATKTKKKQRGPLLQELFDGLALMKEMAHILGVLIDSPSAFLESIKQKKIRELDLDTDKIETLIQERTQARSAKAWADADRFRDELTEMGVLIEDTPEGTIWKIR